MSAPVIPPGGTIVDTFRQSFVDVPVDAEKDNAIDTTKFLDAAESLTTIFGSLNYARCSPMLAPDCAMQMPLVPSPSPPSSPTWPATSRFVPPRWQLGNWPCLCIWKSSLTRLIRV